MCLQAFEGVGCTLREELSYGKVVIERAMYMYSVHVCISGLCAWEYSILSLAHSFHCAQCKD